MDSPDGANWIAGGWRPAGTGHTFELEARTPPSTPRGTWPRSGPRDVREALEVARGAGGAWARLARGERLELALGALDLLEADASLAARLAPGLGAEPELARELLGEDLFRAREALEILRDGSGTGRGGVGLFAAHWSDLVGSLLARLARRLLEGSTALVVSDGVLPEAADALARALHGAGLPAGVVGLLHEDGREALRAGLGSPDLAWARLRGSREELAELTRGRDGGRDGQAFGAGLTEWSLWPLASAVHVVGARDDPEAQAARVFERGLDPARTLAGQLPDRIGRVLCHERVLSRFTEALLARLEACPALGRPWALVERGRFDWLREAWSLGLDEGAAPIFGEAPSEADRRDPQDGTGSGTVPSRPPQTGPEAPEGTPRRGRIPRRASPMVFTNVEPGGRLARLDRPAPLLRLVRVSTDEEAHALRRALERPDPKDPEPAP